MDAEAVDLGTEVGEPVQRRLGGAPVEPVAPVPDQLTEVGEIGSVVPRAALDLVGVPRARQPRPQVAQDLVAHLDAERLHEISSSVNRFQWGAARYGGAP